MSGADPGWLPSDSADAAGAVAIRGRSWPSVVRGIGGWTALAAAAVAAAAVVLPLRPDYLAPTLDGSFAAVLHHAAALPDAERPRLISTYGPLGHLHYTLYLPATWGWLVASRAALAGVLCAAIAWVGLAAWRSPWVAGLLLAAGAPLLGSADARIFLLFALAVLVELVPDARPPLALRVALGTLLGLTALVKVTFLIAGVVVLGPLTLAAALQRRLPVTAVAALGAALVAWFALGRGAADALAYVVWSLRDITPGYSAAMSLRTTPALVAHAALVSAAVLVWASVLARRCRPPRWWALPIAFGGLLLLQFKAGFVRADVHVFTTAFALALEGLLLAAATGRRRRAVLVGIVLLAALPGTLLAHAVAVHRLPTTAFRFVPPAEIVERLRAVPAIVRGHVLLPRHAQHLRDLNGLLPLPGLQGGVDMLGVEQSALIAAQRPYRPRPVFHGYMAYTPRLAAANASYLAGRAAPRWLLFRAETIDGRLPALDDAAVWPLLLSHYRPAGMVGGYALLERRHAPRPWRRTSFTVTRTTTGAVVAVPPDDAGVLWARIEVPVTVAERAMSVLFTAPYVMLDVITADNAVRRYRLIPAVAADGFLLSPVIDRPAALLALHAGTLPMPANAVRALRVQVLSPFGQPTPPRTITAELVRLLPERPDLPER